MSTKKEDSGSSEKKKRTGKDMTKGIKCTRCGTTMFVVETRPGEDYIMRYRHCRSCGMYKKTIES